MTKQSGAEFTAQATPPLGIQSITQGDAEVLEAQPDAAVWDAEKTILLPGVTGDADTAWLQDQQTNEWIPVDRFPYSIGRSPDCHARFQDRSFSREHALILQVDGGFVIEDAGSLNGIRVNGHRVGRVLLADGDTLELGNVMLQFRLRPEGNVPEGSPAADVHTGPAALPPAGDKDARRRWSLVVGIVVAVAVLAAVAAYKVQVLNRVTVVEPGTAPAPVVAAAGTPSQAADEPTPKTGDPMPAPAKPALVVAASHEVGKPNQSAAVAAQDSGIKAAAARPQSATAPKPRPGARRVPAAPHRSPARTPMMSAAASTARIEQARTDYLEGHAPQALQVLGAIGASRRHRAAFRERARQLKQDIARVYADYAGGKHAFEQGDKQAGFTRWLRFLSGERALFAGQKSEYAKEVMHAVVAEYIARGNKALMAGHLQDAYRNWQHAARIDPTSTAATSLAAADAQAREMYRRGYRLETVDLAQAKARWRKVLELVPPSSPYYTKASAKLRWYAYLENK